MGIVIALLSIVAAIPLRWWLTMARLKTHGPLRQFGWSAADQADNNASDMVIPMAPLNLHRDSMAPGGAKHTMLFCLI